KELAQTLAAPTAAPAHRDPEEGFAATWFGLDQFEAVAPESERATLGRDQAAAVAFLFNPRLERAVGLEGRLGELQSAERRVAVLPAQRRMAMRFEHRRARADRRGQRTIVREDRADIAVGVASIHEPRH